MTCTSSINAMAETVSRRSCLPRSAPLGRRKITQTCLPPASYALSLLSRAARGEATGRIVRNITATARRRYPESRSAGHHWSKSDRSRAPQRRRDEEHLERESGDWRGSPRLVADRGGQRHDSNFGRSEEGVEVGQPCGITGRQRIHAALQTVQIAQHDLIRV